MGMETMEGTGYDIVWRSGKGFFIMLIEDVVRFG